MQGGSVRDPARLPRPAFAGAERQNSRPENVALSRLRPEQLTNSKLAIPSLRFNSLAMQDALTPMMQQYQRLRKSIPADALLLFRLGDFYELFFEDAKEASALLNVALTKRNGVPMCGVPYHAGQTYVAKLIKAGRRVAICDQTSDPQPGRIVSRHITQVISAGTISDLDLLESKRANYLGAIYVEGGKFGFAYADLSTGQFQLTQLQDRQALLDDLVRVSPSELLVSD